MSDKREIQELIEVLKARDKVKPIAEIEADIRARTETCICNKRVRPTDLEVFNTGVTWAFNNICKGCTDKEVRKLDSTTSKVVCANCRKVFMRVGAYTDDEGFKFEPGKTYHMQRCPLCQEGVESAEIVEKIIFNRKKNKRSKT